MRKNKIEENKKERIVKKSKNVENKKLQDCQKDKNKLKEYVKKFVEQR